MDTTHLEYTAEDLIAHKLQKAGFLVTKPKFDREGTDLIALLQVDDGAKFCRIQCKGRSLKNSDYTNITVPVEYVKGAFCLFLYIDMSDDKTNLFCFFPEDFRKRWKIKIDSKTRRELYYLYLVKKSIFSGDESGIVGYIFNKFTIDRLKEVINLSNSTKELKLFKLIEYKQELISLRKTKNEIERCVTEIKYLEKSIEKQDVIIEERTKRLEHIFKELLGELPPQVVDKIKLCKGKGMSEKRVVDELSRNRLEGISRSVLEYATSYIFKSHRSKL